MLIVNSHQTCVNCHNKFIVSFGCYDSGLARCPWCSANYLVIKKNDSKHYNYLEIELKPFRFFIEQELFNLGDKMEIDNNTLNINDNQVRDLMIFYASKYRDVEFGSLYLTLYPNATADERNRCAYFIRLALGLNPDNRNTY